MTKISVIIPAFNEEQSIGLVINAIPNWIAEIIVVDNNSSDNTNKNALDNGATVLTEKRKGYGYACLKGLDYIASQKVKPDIIVFLDGDYSDYPQEMNLLLQPILTRQADFVVGTRVKNLRENGAMTPQQIFGNWLATFLMKLFFSSKFTDLGPFRAIKYSQLMELNMEDKTYGWTVEMQLKVLKRKISYTEIPVRYRNRIGKSKVSGTVKGTIMAGIKIISWIFKYAFK
jgi:glycosyltransferase involved in cell wall biosynthesis